MRKVQRRLWRSFPQTLEAEEAGRNAINSRSERRLLYFFVCLALFLPFALAPPSGHLAIAERMSFSNNKPIGMAPKRSHGGSSRGVRELNRAEEWMEP
jgi:hypothetical protein